MNSQTVTFTVFCEFMKPLDAGMKTPTTTKRARVGGVSRARKSISHTIVLKRTEHFVARERRRNDGSRALYRLARGRVRHRVLKRREFVPPKIAQHVFSRVVIVRLSRARAGREDEKRAQRRRENFHRSIAIVVRSKARADARLSVKLCRHMVRCASHIVRLARARRTSFASHGFDRAIARASRAADRARASKRYHRVSRERTRSRSRPSVLVTDVKRAVRADGC